MDMRCNTASSFLNAGTATLLASGPAALFTRRKLFRLLIKRKLPVAIVRVLVNLYMGDFMYVDWFGVSSDYSSATNGVK